MIHLILRAYNFCEFELEEQWDGEDPLLFTAAQILTAC